MQAFTFVSNNIKYKKFGRGSSPTWVFLHGPEVKSKLAGNWLENRKMSWLKYKHLSNKLRNMDQLSVEAKIQIESKIQDIVTDLLVWRLNLQLVKATSLHLSSTPNLITVILSTIKSLSLDHPIFSISRTLLLLRPVISLPSYALHWLRITEGSC